MELKGWLVLVMVVVVEVNCFMKEEKVECSLGDPCFVGVSDSINIAPVKGYTAKKDRCGFLTKCSSLIDEKLDKDVIKANSKVCKDMHVASNVTNTYYFLCCDYTLRIVVFSVSGVGLFCTIIGVIVCCYCCCCRAPEVPDVEIKPLPASDFPSQFPDQDAPPLPVDYGQAPQPPNATSSSHSDSRTSSQSPN